MNKTKTLAGLAALGFIAATVTPVDAAVIAKYAFGTNNTSSDSEPNSAAADFVESGGGARSSSTSSAVQSYSSLSSTTLADAVTNADYFGFTVTPSSGYGLNPTSLTFNTLVNASGGAVGTLGGTYVIRSSADSFATDLATFTQLSATVETSPGTARSVTLSGTDLTSPLEYRIYIYKGVASNTAFDGMRVDNVTLNGTVSAVPEPATASLLAFSTFGLLARRRRGTRENNSQN